MRTHLKRVGKWFLYLCVTLFVAYLLLVVFVRPSNNRNWTRDQAVLSTATIDGDTVHIKNIRNNTYRSTTDFDVAYYDKTFDLSKLESVWYIVEPFSGHGAGAAHTFVSFGFAGGEYVSISVEIRKEQGEAFSPLKGLFRKYEIMYVIADERDVVKLRSNYRKDDVFMYPISTTPERMRALFLSMISRANSLAERPQFYNTLTSSCTTNLVSHVNDLVPGRIPFSYKVLMPAYSDELASDIGLIDSDLPITALRAKYRINELAERYTDDPEFSLRIRGL